MKFKKGVSGNLRGRPKGARDKRIELRKLFESHAPALVNKAVEMALAGDTTAMRLCLDRIVAPKKDDPITLPELRDKPTLSAKAQLVLDFVSDGGITPGEADSIMKTITGLMKVREFDEIEKRIEVLEKRNSK
ncbi:MAG: hypothetical protein HQK86_11585 [Nitrospinae bacterium]|nr:hypothetical protein [Nitrospinota bacterium]